ncbi:MAG: hypothetical protein RJB62_181, partial [Pseudomonadota bacterium]
AAEGDQFRQDAPRGVTEFFALERTVKEEMARISVAHARLEFALAERILVFDHKQRRRQRDAGLQFRHRDQRA